MTAQEIFEQEAIGTTILGCEWLETWDDGESVDKDTPQLAALRLSNGDRIEFSGFGDASYLGKQLGSSACSPITDHERLTWLIAHGAYSLVDHDEYFAQSITEIQHEARKRIDEYILKENAKGSSSPATEGSGD